MATWVDGLQQHVNSGTACVLVTIVVAVGSTPRKAGAHMLVGPEGVVDTIGGGRLELAVVEHAFQLLVANDDTPLVTTRTYNLSKELAQCCGGRVTVQFERHLPHDFQIEVFGAGHVAQELARVLCRLPCQVTFHDDREGWLNKLLATAQTNRGAGVIRTSLLNADIHSRIESLSAGRYYLVMTQCHDRDFECVEAVLSRGDALYCGLIASASKARSFRTRLSRKQFSEAEIEGLTAPLGSQIKTGDTPMEVAVAAVSDLLTTRAEAARESSSVKRAELITVPRLS